VRAKASAGSASVRVEYMRSKAVMIEEAVFVLLSDAPMYMFVARGFGLFPVVLLCFTRLAFFFLLVQD
jgi:hypothetical protein